MIIWALHDLAARHSPPSAAFSHRRLHNSVRRRTGRVRQFFGYAVKQKAISENPLDGLPASVHGNTIRQQFVERADVAQALDAATCPELRPVIALSRYTGCAFRVRWFV